MFPRGRPSTDQEPPKIFSEASREAIWSMPGFLNFLCALMSEMSKEFLDTDNVKDFVRGAFLRLDYKHERDQQDEVEIKV